MGVYKQTNKKKTREREHRLFSIQVANDARLASQGKETHLLRQGVF